MLCSSLRSPSKHPVYCERTKRGMVSKPETSRCTTHRRVIFTYSGFCYVAHRNTQSTLVPQNAWSTYQMRRDSCRTTQLYLCTLALSVVMFVPKPNLHYHSSFDANNETLFRTCKDFVPTHSTRTSWNILCSLRYSRVYEPKRFALRT